MLTIKSQTITPVLAPQSPKISFAVSQEKYYAVFSLESREALSTQVAQNILTDILAHTLLLDDSQAVLPVMEESLKACKEALQKIEPNVIFNAVLALFKDDFVYVSIYGDAKALYLDGSGVVHVDTDSEGKYAGGSQKIEDGKVMILCSADFFKRFPPKSLVSLDKPILAQDLDDLSSAVILKVDKVDEEKADKAKEKGEDGDEKKKRGDKDADAKDNKDEVGGKKKPGTGAVVTLSGDSSTKVATKASAGFNSKQDFRKFLKPLLIALVAIGLLIGSYFILKVAVLKSNGTPSVNQTTNTNSDQNTAVKETPAPSDSQENPQDKEIQSELSKKLDEANKVRRVQPQVFYDISITDARANPTELAQGQKYLAVSDASQGKIYISAKDVTKFEELPQLFPGVKNLLFDGDTLIFTDNEGVKFYAIATKSVNKSYLVDPNHPVLGPSSEYLGFTYAVSSDKLVKFTKSGTRLVGALWSQKEEFTNAVSLDIDGSIYVLFSNGNLEKYTAGAKADFSIVGLDKAIQEPLKVVADADFKQIYVADGEEGRIIAFDEDGVLDFQLKPELGSEWTALKSFDISADEKTFYILSGTKVFEFKL